MGVSMKSPGCATPAQHQTISGGSLLFQLVASAMTRGAAAGSVRSALREWNRWEEWRADAWVETRGGLDGGESGGQGVWAHGNFLEGGVELFDVARDDYYAGAFLREDLRRAEA